MYSLHTTGLNAPTQLQNDAADGDATTHVGEHPTPVDVLS